MRTANAGKHNLTTSNGGSGFLFLQRFDKVHVILRRNTIEISGVNNERRGGTTPWFITRSLSSGQSPENKYKLKH